MEDTYCFGCDQIVSLIDIEEIEEHMFWGEKFTFLTKSAVCPNCDTRYLTEEAHDYNLDTMRKMIQERHGPYPN